MADVKMMGYKPLKFVFGQIHISGGHGTKPSPVISKAVKETDGSTTNYVKMAHTEVWLALAATGVSKWRAGSFGRTSLLDQLGETVQKYADGDVGDTLPVQDSEEYDPMTEVDQEQQPANISPTKTKSQGKKRKYYYTNHARNTTISVAMPARCPEEDPGCTQVRPIRLYIENRKTIWLHIDDVEWAVRYLFVQNHLQGVPLVSDESPGPV